MKINILSSQKINEYFSDNRNEFSQNELNFLLLLEDDINFEASVFNLRKLLKLPKNGLSIDLCKSLSEKLPSFLITSKIIKIVNQGYEISGPDLIKGVSQISEDYNFGSGWSTSLTIYIVFNCMIPPEFDEIYNIVSLSDMVSDKSVLDWLPCFYPIAILLTHKISKREFLKMIDSEWSRISKLLPIHTKTPVIRVQNIKLKKRIFDLRERKGDSFPEIAGVVSNEDRTYGEDEIRVILHRYKVALSSLRKRNST